MKFISVYSCIWELVFNWCGGVFCPWSGRDNSKLGFYKLLLHSPVHSSEWARMLWLITRRCWKTIIHLWHECLMCFYSLCIVSRSSSHSNCDNQPNHRILHLGLCQNTEHRTQNHFKYWQLYSAGQNHLFNSNWHLLLWIYTQILLILLFKSTYYVGCLHAFISWPAMIVYTTSTIAYLITCHEM